MAHFSRDTMNLLKSLLKANEFVPRELIVSTIDGGDLTAWLTVYDVVTRAYKRIRPPLELKEAFQFLLRYYLRCMREGVDRSSPFDPDKEVPHSAYEAAWELMLLLIWAWNTNDRPRAGASKLGRL